MKKNFCIISIFFAFLFSVSCKEPNTDPGTSTPVASENQIAANAVVSSAQSPPNFILTPTITKPSQLPTRTPSPTSTWWHSLPATPNQQQIAPTPLPTSSFNQLSAPIGEDGLVIFDLERQAIWAAALGPFPDWEVPINYDSNETMTVTAEFKPTELLEINLDNDEPLEIVLIYVLTPPEIQEITRTFSRYLDDGTWAIDNKFEYGTAVFDDNDTLLWHSNKNSISGSQIKIDLFGLTLSEDTESVLISTTWRDGPHEKTWFTLYFWRDTELSRVWSGVAVMPHR